MADEKDWTQDLFGKKMVPDEMDRFGNGEQGKRSGMEATARIDRKDLDKYKLSLDLKRILKVMESEKLSEIIYYDDKGKWRSKTV